MSSLLTLSQWLSGVFENQEQAIAQPIWFVHLRLWQRPLPRTLDNRIAFFLEQANTLTLDQPYRQRIVALEETVTDGQLRAYYYAFKDPGKFRGAGENPTLLSSLQPSDLDALTGCVLSLTQMGDRFVGKMEPGAHCCFDYQGQTRYVELGFEVEADRFRSFDRGIDPATGTGLWGALMGPYELRKIQAFPCHVSSPPTPDHS